MTMRSLVHRDNHRRQLQRAAPEPAVVQRAGLVLLLARENARLNAAREDSLRELAGARARVTEASDLERRRLERDLHDGAQQRLTTIQVKLQLAQEACRDQDLARLLAPIADEAAKAIKELRALARGVYPAVLADFGPAVALRTVALEAPIPVRVIDKGIGRSPGPVEAAVYFCSLEAIQNAIKHAGGHASVTVLLTRDRRRVRFEVADDGVGMDTSTRSDGIGMSNMRDRISAVAGDLEISSLCGRGVTVRGTVPDDGRVDRFEPAPSNGSPARRRRESAAGSAGACATARAEGVRPA